MLDPHWEVTVPADDTPYPDPGHVTQEVLLSSDAGKPMRKKKGHPSDQGIGCIVNTATLRAKKKTWAL